MFRSTAPVLVLLAGALALSAGCANRKPSLSAEAAERLAALTYPREAEDGGELDILIEKRGGDRVFILNRTPRTFENVRLWLNREYVTELEHIRIGKHPPRPLRAFVNRHGESFPVAGPLTPDKARPLVSAELHDPETNLRYRLPVRLEPEWQRTY